VSVRLRKCVLVRACVFLLMYVNVCANTMSKQSSPFYPHETCTFKKKQLAPAHLLGPAWLVPMNACGGSAWDCDVRVSRDLDPGAGRGARAPGEEGVGAGARAASCNGSSVCVCVSAAYYILRDMHLVGKA
jgi:hypothetical protein